MIFQRKFIGKMLARSNVKHVYAFRKAMSCCPPGSLPKLVATHKAKGDESTLPGTDLPVYVVGSGEKVVIHYYDIWGWNGGR